VSRPQTVVIRRERPDEPDAAMLVVELEAQLATLYPAESRHGFSVDRLVGEGVDFFVLRVDGRPAGCGGILFVDATDDDVAYGEIKRMYVRPEYRRHGYGIELLERLAEHARSRGYRRLRLETGSRSPDAMGLYERQGFYRIAPFGPYTDDPLTPCYERLL
jgi:GNAT superfamily N-acetyltransferase